MTYKTHQITNMPDGTRIVEDYVVITLFGIVVSKRLVSTMVIYPGFSIPLNKL